MAEEVDWWSVDEKSHGPQEGQPQSIYVQAGQNGGMGFIKTNAVIALVFSILGFLVCPLFVIPGLILGNQATKITSTMPGHPDHGAAVASKWISWITLAIWVIFMMIFGASFLAMFGIAATTSI